MRLALQEHPDLLAAAHILQEAQCWDIIFCRGTNLALCELGVVLSAKQTS